MSQQTPQRPVKVFRRGKVQATIWLHITQRDGQTFTQLRASVEKRYRDKTTGEFRTTHSYFASDMADLVSVARRTLGYLERNKPYHDATPPGRADPVQTDVPPSAE